MTTWYDPNGMNREVWNGEHSQPPRRRAQRNEDNEHHLARAVVSLLVPAVVIGGLGSLVLRSSREFCEQQFWCTQWVRPSLGFLNNPTTQALSDANEQLWHLFDQTKEPPK